MILAAFQRLSALPDDMVRTALSGMEPAAKEYLSGARGREKATGVMMGRDLLKRLGAALLRREPEQIALEHDAAGRPYLAETQGQISGGGILVPPGFCTLSHSRECVLAAVSDEAPVGCDTDQLRGRAYPVPALTGFFSEKDVEYLSEISDPAAQRLELTRLWTRKEAVFKLIGKSDRQSLHLCDESRVRDTLGIVFSERILDQKEVLTIAVKADNTRIRWVEV